MPRSKPPRKRKHARKDEATKRKEQQTERNIRTLINNYHALDKYEQELKENQ